MFIIDEAQIMSTPKKVAKNKDKVRFETVLQTTGDVNRNHRRYSYQVMNEGVQSVYDRIREGTFFGELDHPITSGPTAAQRQLTVLYKEISHRILETGWDGNKLIGIVETVRTPNGTILKNLVEDGIKVGFSFRGMGDLRTIHENGIQINEVIGPLIVCAWDSVSLPSHKEAQIIKLVEGSIDGMRNGIANSSLLTEGYVPEFIGTFKEKDNLICTNEGICYLPNDFDKMVETRVIELKNRFDIF